MRVSGLWCVAAWVACLLPITASAQNTTQRRAAVIAASEDQTEPYHKHRDTRHGHDHYYPDRGAIVRDLPVGTIGTSYAGVSYRYHDGIWLEPRGPAYMVVAPPVGLIAPTLPLYSTVVTHGSDSFLYCNDTYYRPRPDLGGYEVVNDPAMETGSAPPAEPEALVGGRMPSAPVAGATPPGAPAVGAGAAATFGAAALVGGATPVSTAAAPAITTQLGAASVGPPAGGTVVPVVAREALPREASFSGGAMPGANTGAVRPGATTSSGETSASLAAAPSVASVGVATPSSAMPSSATPLSGAAAASVPAASLGTSAGTSAPAAPAGALAAGTPKVPKVFLYPRNGQSADQQARDRYDCYRFAVAQSGFDPLRTSGSAPTPASEQQSDFDRAQGACFEGRGYSNR
jgi:hypothetical protein